MLTITIPATEFYNDDTGEFLALRSETLQLEHSLVSISKWESKWKKPFLSKDEKTALENLDYIRCMTINPVNSLYYNFLTNDMMQKIFNYIEDPMTATTINDRRSKKGGTEQVITSELIYYWMISLNIPVEFQKWHLNRLLTLIRVCSIKNDPGKPMPKKEQLANNYALNAQRRAAMRTRG